MFEISGHLLYKTRRTTTRARRKPRSACWSARLAEEASTRPWAWRWRMTTRRRRRWTRLRESRGAGRTSAGGCHDRAASTGRARGARHPGRGRRGGQDDAWGRLAESLTGGAGSTVSGGGARSPRDRGRRAVGGSGRRRATRPPLNPNRVPVRTGADLIESATTYVRMKNASSDRAG